LVRTRQLRSLLSAARTSPMTCRVRGSSAACGVPKRRVCR
jgi:hypothetical protein